MATKQYTDIDNLQSFKKLNDAEIYQTVGAGTKQYSTSGLNRTIKYYGYGLPQLEGSQYVDKLYLDQNTGKVYECVEYGSAQGTTYEWELFTTLTLLANTKVTNVTESTHNGCVKVLRNGVNTDVPIKGYSALATKVSEHDYDLARSEYVEYSDVSTFNQAAPINALKVETKIEPVQDLHGYDHPWVGGAGKNLCPFDSFSFTSNSSWCSLTGTSAVQLLDGSPVSLKAGTYYAKVTDGINIDTMQVADSSGSVILNSGNGSFVLSSDDSVYIRVKQVSTSATTSGKLQIESGSSATSWTPYTNICPISGRSEVNVQRLGKNLIPYIEQGNWLFANGTPDSGAGKYVRTPKIKCKPNTSYTASNASGITNKGFVYWDFNGNYIGYDVNTATCTTPANAYYIAVNFTSSNTITPSDVINPQLELGSTATAYEPYQGNTYTIQLGDTIYGGELDVITGKMVVNRAEKDLGDLTYTYSVGAGLFYSGGLTNALKPTLSSQVIDAICEGYAVTSRQLVAERDGLFCIDTSGDIDFRNTSFAGDVTAFKNSVTGMKVVYPLATPFTIQLTPQQIKLLQGTNTVYSDSGDIYIEYQPDNAIGEAVRIVENEYDSKIGSLSVLNGMLCMTFNE